MACGDSWLVLSIVVFCQLLEGAWPIDGHCVQNLVEQLQSSMQMNFDPARCVLDGVARIIRTPALDKAQPENAKTSQIVDANASGCGQTLIESGRGRGC